MLRLQYNNKFLSLLPGSAIEMERNSPLFLSESVLAEYSLPITILYDEPNIALLGDVFFEHGIKNKLKLPVNIFDGATYRYPATVIVNTTQTNRHTPGKGNVQGYLLTGVSEFFNPIKGKKMTDLELGGARTFPFTSWDPADASNGFWQHVHETWTGDFDYVFVPVRNETWIELDGFTGWMNQLGRGLLDGGLTETPGQLIPYSWPVAMPKLKNTLQLIFDELEWKLDTSGLNDVYWEKLILLNTNPIKTTHQTGEVDGIPTIEPFDNITIQLRKCFSPEVTISDFILTICKRYGWAPVFDSDKRTCFLLALKEVGNGTVKDFTRYAGPATLIDFTGDAKKFSFKNTFPSNDGAVSSPDFTNFTIAPPVLKRTGLPTPSTEYDNSLIYSFYENAWYQVIFDETVGDRIWQKFADNIYDEEVKESTDSFETNCTTLPAVITDYRRSAEGVEYYGFFARCEQPRNKEWGIRTLIYHGLVTDVLEDGSAGTMQYPFAGDTIVMPDGSLADGWSNVYRHRKDNIDYGIIDYWFKNWLNINRINTPTQKNLYLPLHELEQLQWSDIINIFNQPFLLQKYIEPIPYRGFIQATLLPLILNETELVTAIPDAGGNIIYLRFGWEDEVDGDDVYIYGTLSQTSVKYAKPIIRAYADAAATVPLITSSLKIYLRYDFGSPGSYYFLGNYSTRISGTNYNISQDELYNETNPTTPYPATGDGRYLKSYRTVDDVYIESVWTINPDAAYIVI